MNNFANVVIVVEGGGPTGGAERVAFETVELISAHGIPVRIISSASKIDQKYLDLPGVTGIALNLPPVWEKFFSKNRILSYPLRNEDRSLLPLYKEALKGLNPEQTVVHIHGFHSHFSHLIISASLEQGFRTHLHAHDYGYICPNTTLFNYPENRICELDPLSAACQSSACISATDQNIKQFRFRRAITAFESKKLHERLTSIVCPSPFAREIMAKKLGDLGKLRVLRCPVQPASPDKLNPAASQTYLWIGRLTAEKNPDIALKAADLAGITLTIIGDGPLRTTLEQEFPYHNFLGWKSPEEVNALQSSARCLVMSSAWYETASLVVLECLAAGIPCIIGNRSAATSWLTDEENGITFENGSITSLAEALEKTKDDSALDRMSVNAYSRYWQDPCSPENYTRNLLEVYNLK
jgi:glycosyltransferase involved in cell wall biosynthesis